MKNGIIAVVAGASVDPITTCGFGFCARIVFVSCTAVCGLDAIVVDLEVQLRAADAAGAVDELFVGLDRRDLILARSGRTPVCESMTGIV